MKTATVSKEDRVLIPKEIMEKYNIRRGDKVNIVDYGDVISMIPVSKDVVSVSSGIFKSKRSLTKSLLDDRKKEIKR